MQQQFAGQVEIVGIGGSSTSVADLEQFVENFGVSHLQNVADTDNSVWERYEVFSQPVLAFINNDGATEVIRLATQELAERIKLLLAT